MLPNYVRLGTIEGPTLVGSQNDTDTVKVAMNEQGSLGSVFQETAYPKPRIRTCMRVPVRTSDLQPVPQMKGLCHNKGARPASDLEG